MRTLTKTMLRNCALAFVACVSFAIATPSHAGQSYSGIVMDAKTGEVLYSKNADSRKYPASLTKMMTLYMLFDAMESGKVTKSTRIRFSSHASSMQPSKLGIKAGQSISAEQAILALVTKSANDAAAAVAEHLGGSESNFAAMMTKKANSIGMKNTIYKNASGLPDRRQVTTARDQAILGIALREHFPKYYGYFETRVFTMGKKRYGNHNRLLGKVRGVDGIKTGYTRDAGFNLVSSVQDNGRSIVGVVLGGKSGRSRNDQMASLIRSYLPKASKGRDRDLIAKGPTKAVFASLFKKVDGAPIPEQRPDIEEASSSLQAYVEPAKSIPQPLKKPKTDSIVTASLTPKAELGSNKQSKSDVSGWQVQIGAMPSEANAVDYLEKARAKASDILAKRPNYIETTTKNGATLYRARFAGFASKDAAWSACASLKKKKFNCLAIQN